MSTFGEGGLSQKDKYISTLGMRGGEFLEIERGKLKRKKTRVRVFSSIMDFVPLKEISGSKKL